MTFQHHADVAGKPLSGLVSSFYFLLELCPVNFKLGHVGDSLLHVVVEGVSTGRLTRKTMSGCWARCWLLLSSASHQENMTCSNADPAYIDGGGRGDSSEAVLGSALLFTKLGGEEAVTG